MVILPIEDLKNHSSIKIQSIFRGYYIRKINKKLKDSMTFKLLNNCIDSFIRTINDEKTINKLLNKKKIRLSNFPSHISENIVKFVIFKKYKIMPNWDTDSGDLEIGLANIYKSIRCEVKGSIDLSNGPSSFGPNEEWDYIYFVDAVCNYNKKYKVYECKISNKSEIWKNLMVNKKQTYYDQCLQKRRPRIAFNNLKEQLGKYCTTIFDGYLSELDNTI